MLNWLTMWGFFPQYVLSVRPVSSLGTSRAIVCLMLLPSWHVHCKCAFLLAETPRSVRDRCVAEELVQWPPLESVSLDKSKSATSSAVSCSASGSLPSAATSTALTFTVKPRTCCESARNSFWPFTAAVSFWSWPTPCLHAIELLFHTWLSCSLHFRFNQLRSDVQLLSSACDDLPCILDTIFRLILDTSCRGRRGLHQVSLLSLIPPTTPPALASQARHCTCRCGLQLGLRKLQLSLLRHRAFQNAAGKCSTSSPRSPHRTACFPSRDHPCAR